MRFNWKDIPIPNLQDWVAYTAFLNGLLPEQFKFSEEKRKITTLIETLRTTQDFIQAIEWMSFVIMLEKGEEKKGMPLVKQTSQEGGKARTPTLAQGISSWRSKTTHVEKAKAP